MSVTGHKSVSSLSVYKKVDQSEKIEIGQSLANYVLLSKEVQPKTPSIDISTEKIDDNLELDDWNFDVFPNQDTTTLYQSASKQPVNNNSYPSSKK